MYTHHVTPHQMMTPTRVVQSGERHTEFITYLSPYLFIPFQRSVIKNPSISIQLLSCWGAYLSAACAFHKSLFHLCPIRMNAFLCFTAIILLTCFTTPLTLHTKDFLICQITSKNIPKLLGWTVPELETQKLLFIVLLTKKSLLTEYIYHYAMHLLITITFLTLRMTPTVLSTPFPLPPRVYSSNTPVCKCKLIAEKTLTTPLPTKVGLWRCSIIGIHLWKCVCKLSTFLTAPGLECSTMDCLKCHHLLHS